MSKDGHEELKRLPKPVSPLKIATTNSAFQKGFVPPALQEVGKLAAGVAAITPSSGSATGNPRNKHALQPGHSLMDWIRLGASGKDLTGVGDLAGKLSITPRQLAQHDKATDAWIAIRGKVYNVTQYLHFHPGGPEELMRGVGSDATTLFDQVHAWVNYEKLLQKCYLGRLVTIDPSVDTQELFFGKPSSQKAPEVASNNNTAAKSPPLLPPNKVAPLDDTEQRVAVTEREATELAKDAEETLSCNGKPSESVNLTPPRFDWIQKTDYITVIFYTRPFSNPQVEVGPPNPDEALTVRLEYDRAVFANEIKFLRGIQWPCQIKINYETGKVEVQFRKRDGGIWENYGNLVQKCHVAAPVSAAEFKHKYSVINKVDVNYNTALLELQRVDETRLTVPVGRHVRVFGGLQGEEISRSYTPVPASLFAKFKPQTFITDNICLMVKSYSKGSISKHVCNRRKGDVLEISKPLGSFSLASIENRETFLLLAAGTGITPIMGVLLFLLERRIRRCQRIDLLFFNRTEEDILARSQLDALQGEDSRLKVDHILSQADQKWTGQRGQITRPLLETALVRHLHDTAYAQSDVFAFVCGPTPFTNLTHILLTDLGFKQDQLHLFLG